mmetsp:Transcript_3712/g.9543  ORF Transcript_3712/g.9543 Transcript_3712/m.9543 type:complete len:712 (-) Transcript_3712:155-2290(-)
MSVLIAELGKCLHDLTSVCEKLKVQHEGVLAENQVLKAQVSIEASSPSIVLCAGGDREARCPQTGSPPKSGVGAGYEGDFSEIPLLENVLGRKDDEALKRIDENLEGREDALRELSTSSLSNDVCVPNDLPGALPMTVSSSVKGLQPTQRNDSSSKPILATSPRPFTPSGVRGSASEAGSRGMSSTAVLKRQNSWFVMPSRVNWQWEHRSGFRSYLPRQNEKIELAYQLGHSKVRLKSGKHGATPMELFFADMIQYDPTTSSRRNVRRHGPMSCFTKMRRIVMEYMNSWQTGLPRRETFEQYTERRDRIVHGTLVEEYNVEMYYHTEGCCQRIAKSKWFFGITMLLVLLNSIWLWEELDTSGSPEGVDEELSTAIIENTFCAAFTLELLTRFGAFEVKRNCIKDTWFRFDMFLVGMMVLETWMIPLFHVALTGGDSSTGVNKLSILRITRLVRLARVLRLMKIFPEMFTLCLGINKAMRSTFFALLMLGVLLYMFSILFRTQVGIYPVEYQALEEKYFSSCTSTFWTLLVHGTFLDAASDILIGDLIPTSSVLTMYFLVFVLLSSFTVLNMLTGIICEVISGVKKDEDESAERSYLRSNLVDIMDCYDKNGDQLLGKEEFRLLMQNSEALLEIRNFGTDINGVNTILDVVFDSAPQTTKISFEEFISIVLRLRGQHSAKVTDVIEVREYARQRFDQMERALEPLLPKFGFE